MANFPSSIPSYAGFTSTHTLSQDQHASQHNSEQGDIIAIATKVGTGASTPTNNTVLRGNGTGTTTFDQVHAATDISGILGTANGGTGTTSTTGTGSVVFATAPTTTNQTLAGQPTITDFTNANHDHSNASKGGTLNGATAIQTKTIPSGALNLTKSGPDANGWIKRDYGNWQTYEQTVGVVGAVVASGTPVLVATLSMPVGITDSSSLRFWSGSLKGFAGRVTVDLDNGNVTTAVTSMPVYLYNNTGGSITESGYIYVFAITVQDKYVNHSF